MGWASGSQLMGDIIDALVDNVPVKAREKVYYILIPAFEDFDCDTLDECRGEDPIFDRVLDKLNPPDE